MKIYPLLAAAVLQFGLAGGAWACQPNYTVKDGDTLFTIAEAQLGDLTKWSLIFYNNPELQGGSLLDVAPLVTIFGEEESVPFLRACLQVCI